MTDSSVSPLTDADLDTLDRVGACTNSEVLRALVAEVRARREAAVVTEQYGPCWVCSGVGFVASYGSTASDRPCGRCNGSGQVVTSRTMSLPPAPVPDPPKET